MKILLAEDNINLATWVARLLTQSNYVVDTFHRGDDADEALKQNGYDVVILDLALPGLEGIEVLKALRARKTDTPVIILTANDAVSARVAGLDAGADDYLIKPFDAKELEARIRVQLRRGRQLVEPEITCGALCLKTESREILLSGAKLELPPRERAVLELLIRRAGRPISKNDAAANIFGLDDETNASAVEIYIHRLRKKLEGHNSVIHTVRGLGYVLRAADG